MLKKKDLEQCLTHRKHSIKISYYYYHYHHYSGLFYSTFIEHPGELSPQCWSHGTQLVRSRREIQRAGFRALPYTDHSTLPYTSRLPHHSLFHLPHTQPWSSPPDPSALSWALRQVFHLLHLGSVSSLLCQRTQLPS